MKTLVLITFTLFISTAYSCKSGQGGCNDCPDLTKKKKHATIIVSAATNRV